MSTKSIVSMLGFGLVVALGVPGAVAQNTNPDTNKRVHTEAIECNGSDDVELKNVEIRAPITADDDCELELEDVVVRGQGTVLSVSDEADAELEDVEISGDVSLSGNGELEMEDSTIQGDLTLTDESEADLDDSQVTGEVNVSGDAEYDD